MGQGRNGMKNEKMKILNNVSIRVCLKDRMYAVRTYVLW